MSKKKSENAYVISQEKVVTPRFVLALLFVVGGIAWLAFYYLKVRVPFGSGLEPGAPSWMGDLERYNYTIGFALVMVGLVLAANKATPLGRGRGVVVGMLGCFLIGLIWIAVYYMFAAQENQGPGMIEDMGNYNLLVGIAFMAVGFAYATKWE